MLFKNDIFAFEGRRYRFLHADNYRGVAWVFALDDTNAWPISLPLAVTQRFSGEDNQTLDFSYAKPGKKTLDFPRADAKGLRQLEQFLSSEAAQDKRFTVKELLQAIGIWEPFRHNRQQFPLLCERIERFKASNQSERQTGLRPYWRERLRSRKPSKRTEDVTS